MLITTREALTNNMIFDIIFIVVFAAIIVSAAKAADGNLKFTPPTRNTSRLEGLLFADRFKFSANYTLYAAA